MTLNRLVDRHRRRVLWIALAANAGMFAAEIGAGAAAGSAALLADALEFMGDAANYGVSLWVAGMALAVRASAAIAKGVTMLLCALWVLIGTIQHALAGTLPEAPIMGAVGFAALVANLAVAALLYSFRGGDANRRSV